MSVTWEQIAGPDGPLWVSSDYLRGDDGTYVRGSVSAAAPYLEQYGARLPSSVEELRAIYGVGARLPFTSSAEFAGQYPSASNYDELVEGHNRVLSGLEVPDGVAFGHMKDLMEGGVLYHPDQGLQRAHVSNPRYRDYSTGIRLVRDTPPEELARVAQAAEAADAAGLADDELPLNVRLIRETAEALQIDPIDLATVISYETGGTLDPLQRGPTTQWGQHRGLIQFGEPQARRYGVDFSSPDAALRSQLGAEGAIVRYLTSNGFEPGMGILDLYSTINAGAPGLYNRSDANNGGAPGTVRDKVEQQFGPHRAAAERLFAGYVTPTSRQPRPASGSSPDRRVASAGVGPTRARAAAGLPLGTRTPPAAAGLNDSPALHERLGLPKPDPDRGNFLIAMGMQLMNEGHF